MSKKMFDEPCFNKKHTFLPVFHYPVRSRHMQFCHSVFIRLHFKKKYIFNLSRMHLRPGIESVLKTFGKIKVLEISNSQPGT